MKDHSAIVVSNERIFDTLYLMSLRAEDLAKAIRPGQFVHLAIPSLQANILRRPFSIYSTDAQAGTVDILYQVVGTGTQDMTLWPCGYKTMVIGPIGSTWQPPSTCKHAMLVGGGVGSAPLFILCEELISKGFEVDVVLGASTKDALVCRQRYEDAFPSQVICTTDDGSFGTHGFATVEVDRLIAEAKGANNPYDFAAICGPAPLMKLASKSTLDAGIFTQVSLERKMACGIGACLSCVVDTVIGRKRVCVDGPIFNAEEVVW